HHPLVEKVYYPGLSSHPQYDVAKSQMTKMGGIVSFEIKGGLSAGKRFIRSLNMVMLSFSLGDPESLVQHPASMTHSSITEHELSNFGISIVRIRLSAGLEDTHDIISDIEQALDKVRPVVTS